MVYIPLCLGLLLRRACEIFVRQVREDDWALIMQRLGLSEDTIQHIEDELPGGYNLPRRIRRSLEYWTGMDLSRLESGRGTAMVSGTTQGGTELQEPLTSMVTANSLAEVEEATPAPITTADHTTTAETDAAGLTLIQPITLRFVPSVVGPKASPERLLHVLKLLDQTELAEAIEAVIVDSHMQQL